MLLYLVVLTWLLLDLGNWTFVLPLGVYTVTTKPSNPINQNIKFHNILCCNFKKVFPQSLKRTDRA